jgi:hypothetical protein
MENIRMDFREIHFCVNGIQIPYKKLQFHARVVILKDLSIQ